MKDYSDFYRARSIIGDILRKDFIGPVSGDEFLPEPPQQYYIMGKLYPQQDSVEVLDLARNPFLENGTETYDASVSLSNQNNPSSMGITFTVRPGVKSVVLHGSYAMYEPLPYESAIALGAKLPFYRDNEKKPKIVWARQQFDYRHEAELVSGKITVIPLSNQVRLKVYINKEYSDSGEKVVTVAMINENSADPAYR